MQSQYSPECEDIPLQSSESYFERGMRKVQDKKFDAEVSRRMLMISKNGQSFLEQTFLKTLNNNNNNNTNNNIFKSEIKVIKYEEAPTKKGNKKLQAMQAMAQKVEALQMGHSKSKEIIRTNVNDVVITDRATLFAMLPQRKAKLNIHIEPPRGIPLSPIREITHETIRQATQHFQLNSMLIRVESVRMALPVMVCKATNMHNLQSLTFVYRPGFDTSLMRQELSESQLDFEFAPKPEPGGIYVIHYRTYNSQNYLVVEKLEKQH